MIDDYDIFYEIVQFIYKAKIMRFADLVRISLDNGYDEWIRFIIDHDYLVIKYIESRN